MRQFEKAFRARGESTVLFEDPDYSAIADQQVLQELNRKV